MSDALHTIIDAYAPSPKLLVPWERRQCTHRIEKCRRRQGGHAEATCDCYHAWDAATHATGHPAGTALKKGGRETHHGFCALCHYSQPDQNTVRLLLDFLPLLSSNLRTDMAQRLQLHGAITASGQGFWKKAVDSRTCAEAVRELSTNSADCEALHVSHSMWHSLEAQQGVGEDTKQGQATPEEVGQDNTPWYMHRDDGPGMSCETFNNCATRIFHSDRQTGQHVGEYGEGSMMGLCKLADSDDGVSILISSTSDRDICIAAYEKQTLCEQNVQVPILCWQR